MKKVIITVGVPASGKSTFANNQVKLNSKTIKIERDVIRQSLVPGEFSWKKWGWSREGEVQRLFENELEVAILDDDIQTIIISDTNLKKHYLDRLVDQIREICHEIEIEIVKFPISFEEAVKRDLSRKNPVGAFVIGTMMSNWNKYHHEKKYVPNKKLPSAFIVDLDGTLAHHGNRRGIYDLSKVKFDEIDPVVYRLISNLPDKILIVTGRDDCSKEQTVEWLNEKSVRNSGLFMRVTGDRRPDTVIKSEIFWQDIAPNFNVLGVFEDRPKVARWWRSIGLKVFQVGDPHVEF